MNRIVLHKSEYELLSLQYLRSEKVFCIILTRFSGCDFLQINANGKNIFIANLR